MNANPPTITIGPRLRRELVARLMELAFEIEDTLYLSERMPLEAKFAAIADLLSIRRTKRGGGGCSDAKRKEM